MRKTAVQNGINSEGLSSSVRIIIFKLWDLIMIVFFTKNVSTYRRPKYLSYFVVNNSL